jgi:hypothetical protein
MLVIAIVEMGNPAHVPGLVLDGGDSTNDGVFPRIDTAACGNATAITTSFCDTGDTFCDSGNSIAVHLSYVNNFAEQAAQFVVSSMASTLTTLNAAENATLEINGTAVVDKVISEAVAGEDLALAVDEAIVEEGIDAVAHVTPEADVAAIMEEIIATHGLEDIAIEGDVAAEKEVIAEEAVAEEAAAEKEVVEEVVADKDAVVEEVVEEVVADKDAVVEEVVEEVVADEKEVIAEEEAVPEEVVEEVVADKDAVVEEEVVADEKEIIAEEEAVVDEVVADEKEVIAEEEAAPEEVVAEEEAAQNLDVAGIAASVIAQVTGILEALGISGVNLGGADADEVADVVEVVEISADDADDAAAQVDELLDAHGITVDVAGEEAPEAVETVEAKASHGSGKASSIVNTKESKKAS